MARRACFPSLHTGLFIKAMAGLSRVFAHKCCSHGRGNKNFSVRGKDWASALQIDLSSAAWWFPLLTAGELIQLLLCRNRGFKRRWCEDGHTLRRVIVMWSGFKTVWCLYFVVFAVPCIFVFHPWSLTRKLVSLLKFCSSTQVDLLCSWGTNNKIYWLTHLVDL